MLISRELEWKVKVAKLAERCGGPSLPVPPTATKTAGFTERDLCGCVYRCGMDNCEWCGAPLGPLEFQYMGLVDETPKTYLEIHRDLICFQL